MTLEYQAHTFAAVPSTPEPRGQLRSGRFRLAISELQIYLILQSWNMEFPQIQHKAAVLLANEKDQL